MASDIRVLILFENTCYANQAAFENSLDVIFKCLTTFKNAFLLKLVLKLLDVMHVLTRTPNLG